MKLPKELEQMAERESLLSSQRMAEFDQETADRKVGLRWWHDFTIPATFIGLAVAMAVIAVSALLWIASLFG